MIASYRAAVELDPTLFSSWNNLGVLLAQDGQAGAAPEPPSGVSDLTAMPRPFRRTWQPGRKPSRSAVDRLLPRSPTTREAARAFGAKTGHFRLSVDDALVGAVGVGQGRAFSRVAQVFPEVRHGKVDLAPACGPDDAGVDQPAAILAGVVGVMPQAAGHDHG